MRPTNQETIDIEKIVCYSQFPREGTCHPTGGHMEKDWGQSGCRGARAKHGQEASLWFHQKRTRSPGAWVLDWLA